MKTLLAEIKTYWQLIAALVGRQLASRYRGSALGFLWSFLNPLFFMLIYTLVFKYYIRFDSVNNYSIYLFCGLLPWIWMSSGILEAANSITGSGSLITKSMFPPQVLPLVSVLTNAVHYSLSLILLALFMVFFKVAFGWTLLLLPLLMIVQTIFMYGVSLMFASLNVFYRDIQHLLANLFNFMFFLCPILYPPETVPERFRFTIDLNPFALFISFYHDLILERELPGLSQVIFLLACTALVVIIGTKVYSRYYESFAEYL